MKRWESLSVPLAKWTPEPTKSRVEPLKYQRLARPCLRGYTCERTRRSFCGGLPQVDPGFVWPRKNDVPLHFVAQIACADVPAWQRPDGVLLFFYSNEHWGSNPKDAGFLRVLWQQGQAEFPESQLPSVNKPRFFGLLSRRKGVQRWRKVPLEFRPGFSYPCDLDFPDEEAREDYAEFLEQNSSSVQIGGHPSPIQSNDLEQTCEACTGIPRDDWELLLQLEEVGDQTWGDAGTLYWFVPSQDLKDQRYDRAWLISQCS